MGKFWDWITRRGKERQWSTEELADGLEHVMDAYALGANLQSYLEIERKYGKTPPCPYLNAVYKACNDQTSDWYQHLPEDYYERCKCYRMKNGVANNPKHMRVRTAGWENGCGHYFSNSELIHLLARNKYYVPDVTDYGQIVGIEDSAHDNTGGYNEGGW